MAVLALDVGNSNIAIGVFSEGQLIRHWRIATVPERTGDELWLLLRGLFEHEPLSLRDLQGICVSSVVPSTLYSIEQMARDYTHMTPLVVGPGIKTGLVIQSENQREVGADRIANAVATLERYGAPSIIVDFGTATTFTILNRQGHYIGGLIAPGIKISADALYQRAAKLPRVDLVRPPSIIGRNTVTSMQAGIVYGFAGQVDGVVERIQTETNENYTVVATGGLAPVVEFESHQIQHVHPTLTLEGLYLLWERNKSGR